MPAKWRQEPLRGERVVDRHFYPFKAFIERKDLLPGLADAPSH